MAPRPIHSISVRGDARQVNCLGAGYWPVRASKVSELQELEFDGDGNSTLQLAHATLRL
jgi:hypothetical protein